MDIRGNMERHSELGPPHAVRGLRPHMTEGNKTFKAAPKAIKKEKAPTLFEADD